MRLQDLKPAKIVQVPPEHKEKPSNLVKILSRGNRITIFGSELVDSSHLDASMSSPLILYSSLEEETASEDLKTGLND